MNETIFRYPYSLTLESNRRLMEISPKKYLTYFDLVDFIVRASGTSDRETCGQQTIIETIFK